MRNLVNAWSIYGSFPEFVFATGMRQNDIAQLRFHHDWDRSRFLQDVRFLGCRINPPFHSASQRLMVSCASKAAYRQLSVPQPELVFLENFSAVSLGLELDGLEPEPQEKQTEI